MQFLQSHFSQFTSFGFSGSRSVSPACVPLVVSLCPRGSHISVGDAAGLDATVRSVTHSGSIRFIGTTRIFSVSDYPAPHYAARLALRSIACVRAVAAVRGLWVSFPSSPCPPQLVPCASPFSGSGSGTWASLALAVFLRVHCVVFLPVGVSFPASWRSRCVVSVLGVSSCGGSFVSLSPLPVVAQVSLF